MPFFKYRSIQNLERTLDILVNKRLYAARFIDLNDPMEGVYEYDRALVSELDVWQIKKDKLDWRITSLSTAYNNTLMWAYYADGHRGVTIGLEVLDKSCEVVPVQYIGPASVTCANSSTAQQILSRKFSQWEHESEVRIFSPKDTEFVEVQVSEIILGIEASETTAKIFKAVAGEYCPNVVPRRILQQELHATNSN